MAALITAKNSKDLYFKKTILRVEHMKLIREGNVMLPPRQLSCRRFLLGILLLDLLSIE